MSTSTASAVVTVTIKIPVAGPWGPNCTLDQIHNQAADGALGKLRHALADQDYEIIRLGEIEAIYTVRK